MPSPNSKVVRAKAGSGLSPAWLLQAGRMEYREALELQHRTVAARAAGLLDRDLVIILEHPPVFTLGRHGNRNNLTVPENFLAGRGIEIVQVERGGDITYHGPGQLVAYPVLSLEKLGLGVADYVSALERVMVQTAACWDIEAFGNPKARGVWVAGRKLGSIGISVRRKVGFHGLALNVNNDLEPFSWINPCGIRGCRMTSMALETGRQVDIQQVRQVLADNLGGELGMDLKPLSGQQLASIL